MRPVSALAAFDPLARLFRIRDFSVLWSGSTVSMFGDGIYFVAIAWEVYHLSSSPTALGAVGAAFSLPQASWSCCTPRPCG